MRWRILLFTCSIFWCSQNLIAQDVLALAPPMGWNSWDGYGTTINEAQVKANAQWMAEHLKSFGWQYVTVDMEWFVSNPTAEGNSKTFQYSLDGNGRYTPAVNRFPSSANGAGFKPLADYVHSLGLKFGIHILRGIPKQAVMNKLPIADTSYSAADGADSSDTCPWNFDNFGTTPAQPAAQAYYDSIAKLYAGWGVDLIKVDCISSHPYNGDDIRMIRHALDKAGRPIVLSLSPGPAPAEKLDEMRKYAQMWRISDDIWDIWHNDGPYPKGLGDQFDEITRWAGKSEPGHWPDADMLPFGRLGPAPGWGEPRDTRLSHDEQRMLMTLWVIFPSPLMVGGDLSAADAWTLSLLTNPEVIAVDQHSSGNHPVINTDKTVVWLAQPGSGNAEHNAQHDSQHDDQYLAVFNRTDSKAVLRYEWKDLGLAGKTYRLRDLWERKDLGSAGGLTATLPPHGSLLYRLSPDRDANATK
jgi:alpha-galactosidase